MEFPFFHGKITRRTCEELLSKNRRNGSYLIRESESVEGALCLCVLFDKLIYTYRIFRERQGYFKIQRPTYNYVRFWAPEVMTPDNVAHCLNKQTASIKPLGKTSEGVPERTFRTLKDLIYAYEKPNQGLITNLRYPVKKQEVSRRTQRFMSGKDNIYDDIDDSDYVDILP